MKIADIMTVNPVAIRPDTRIRQIMHLLLDHGISAIPVLDDDRQIVGIVSDGDLLRCVEHIGAGIHRGWVKDAIFATGESLRDYIRSHGQVAADVMTRNVITISDEASTDDLTEIYLTHHVDRVPVVRDGKLVGIVSRVDLLHRFTARRVTPSNAPYADDDEIREWLLRELSGELGLSTGLINVIVEDGTVELWGVVASTGKKKAAGIAAETMPGVKAVKNYLTHVPAWLWVE